MYVTLFPNIVLSVPDIPEKNTNGSPERLLSLISPANFGVPDSTYWP